VDEKKPFHNPFAVLKDKLGDLPRGPEAPRHAKSPPAPAKGPARAVVRLERKGRGGKEVTVVEQLGLPSGALRDWLDDLKSALGCGGAVEGDALVLQGDHRGRLRALLEERGVRRVSVG
jgi:translation initiation factor 1